MHRIVFTDPHLLGAVVGGAEVQLWLLARAFASAGWESHYVTSAEAPETVVDGVAVHHVTASRSKQKHYHDLRDQLNKIKPDLIYQRGRKHYTHLVGKYSIETQTPFVFSASMDLDCVRYKEIHRLKRSATTFEFMRRLPDLLLGDISTLRGIRSATKVLTQTERQSLLMRQNLGIESQVFSNMHDVPDLRSAKKTEPPMILWLANLKAWKRPELFLRMVDELSTKPVRFVMAGSMVDAGRYAKLVGAYEKKYNNFEYRDGVDFEQSNKLIGEAAVFVNTSLPYEGFPNTFIQSWLRETPTVTLGFDPDGLINQLGFGKVADDPIQLARFVYEIATNQEQQKSMGRSARDYAIDKFSLNKNFSKLKDMFQAMLGAQSLSN